MVKDVVCAVIKKDNTYLVGQRNYGEFEGYFEFPGGKVESNESLKEATLREIKEELGINIIVNDVLYEEEFTYPTLKVKLHFISCSLQEETPKFIRYDILKWVKKDDLKLLNFLPGDLTFINKILLNIKDTDF